jgi:ATP-dependent exoDNAse (exonuclease V) alpha subunit
MKDLGSRDSLRNLWFRRGFSNDDVIHLYTTNKEVSKRNLYCLQKKKKPIVRINSVNTGKAKQSTPNQAGGLVSTLYLCEGAKVLLTKNLAQQVGLCNGATGTIVAFVYENDKPPPNLPEYVIVDFGDSYKGRPFFGDDPDKAGWVPIFPETHEWQSQDSTNVNEMASHSRTMLPIRLCYAWTIWKAQGQTLKCKVVVNLGKTEKEHGLTYTAFSRVTKASDIGILGGFPKDRLIDKVAKQAKMKARIREESRLNGIVRRTIQELRNM